MEPNFSSNLLTDLLPTCRRYLADRHDYLRINKLNAIPEIMKMGVRPRHVRPAFPANGFPNWYSMATGLQPFKHGFVDDEMYDTKYKELFAGRAQRHKHWWNKAEPVWISALKQRLQVATYWSVQLTGLPCSDQDSVLHLRPAVDSIP